MTSEEFERDVLPGMIESLKAAFLKAEEQHPGGLKSLFEGMATGPSSGDDILEIPVDLMQEEEQK